MKTAGIRAKIIRAFLIVSLFAAGVTGLLGYLSGRSVLTQSIYDRLTGLRIAKAYHIENYVRLVRNHVLSMSDNLMVLDAIRDFTTAFAELEKSTITPEDAKSLQDFYAATVIPELKKHSEFESTADSLLPKSTAARLLQSRYLVANQDGEGQEKGKNPVDSSQWKSVHDRYDPVFEKMRKLFGYDDILLVSADKAEVVYSTSSQIDLGVTFREGPYATIELGKVVREVLASGDDDFVRIVDFEPYAAAKGLPAAFAVTGIFEGSKILGALVFQFPVDRIDSILSGENRWAEQGLGKSGEVFLMGEDGFMRNDSRFLKEDLDEFSKKLAESGVSQDALARIARLRTTIMTMKLDSPVIQEIFQGKSGTELASDYLGDVSLTSYAPLDVEGLKWGIVAKIHADEALSPLRRFERQLALSLALITALTILAAALAGSRIAAPIRQITQAARAFASGFYEVRVHIRSRDEVQDLAESFNSMAFEIHSKTTKYRSQVQENRRLLENLMPTSVMARMRGRKTTGAGEPFHTDVTLVFLEIEGLFELYENRDAAEATRLIDSLHAQFDAATSDHGVEKLNASGAGYLAACGLSESRFDHSQRSIAFVQEAKSIVKRFNEANATHLFLSAGVHRGPVTSGKLGRHAFVDELWARTIDLAKRPEEMHGHSSIRVSQAVYERVHNDAGLRFSKDQDETDPENTVWILT
ncbi:HAMP domain-containing protein [bacterium]|nr:HAMP domain-containing protein [bacterium]